LPRSRQAQAKRDPRSGFTAGGTMSAPGASAIGNDGGRLPLGARRF
jgi:hypothetical protein